MSDKFDIGFTIFEMAFKDGLCSITCWKVKSIKKAVPCGTALKNLGGELKII